MYAPKGWRSILKIWCTAKNRGAEFSAEVRHEGTRNAATGTGFRGASWNLSKIRQKLRFLDGGLSTCQAQEMQRGSCQLSALSKCLLRLRLDHPYDCIGSAQT